MVAQREHMQVSTPAPIHPAGTSSSYEVSPLDTSERTAMYEPQEQMPVLHLATLLAALLADPEFQQGVADACDQFLGDYDPEPLSENEMIEKGEINLSRWVTQRCNKLCRLWGYEPISYLYNLGSVVGTIAQGLSYAGSGSEEQEALPC